MCPPAWQTSKHHQNKHQQRAIKHRGALVCYRHKTASLFTWVYVIPTQGSCRASRDLRPRAPRRRLVFLRNTSQAPSSFFSFSPRIEAPPLALLPRRWSPMRRSTCTICVGPPSGILHRRLAPKQSGQGGVRPAQVLCRSLLRDRPHRQQHQRQHWKHQKCEIYSHSGRRLLRRGANKQRVHEENRQR